MDHDDFKGEDLPTLTPEQLAALPTLTLRQLALYNGTDRDPIYVAYQGLVYDVSKSRLWRNGKHYEHWAGQDLTPELAKAPHTNRVFLRWPVVAKIG